MFKIKIYIIDTTIELRSNSKAVLAIAINGFFLSEMLSQHKLMVELYAVRVDGSDNLIGEYNSISEFKEILEVVPPAEAYMFNDQTSN